MDVPHTFLLPALVICAWLAAACASAAETQAAAPGINFSRDVQPILSDNCYFCHGPDSAKRKAGLRLDTKEGAFAALGKAKDHFAIVAGKPGESALVERVTSTDPDDVMPPPDSNRALTAAQKELLKRWVAEGAVWGKHWAFVAPQRPPLPQVKDAAWVRSPIDAFVLDRLEREGLRPSPEASKESLIRRVTLDLTGLPPTPQEVRAFEDDKSADAYEKVVDRLLASPRYGERMAWEWLDAARYADTNGYQGDQTRTMWPWRDWVVRAMNENLPYDQFTIKQLAGDLLPNATVDDKVATGFCRNHMINGEGGRIAEENRVEYVMDQSETVGTVWLGLTVGCCRCHDHKYDPLAQKDYYSLFAFFNQTPVNGGGGSGQMAPVVDFATPEQKSRLDAKKGEVKQVAHEVDEIERQLFPRTDAKQPLTESAAVKALPLSGNIIAVLSRAPEARYNDGLGEAVNFFKSREPKYAEALGRLRQAIIARDQFNGTIPRVMMMEDMAKPRDTFVLVKGAYDHPTEKVTANTPASLPPLPAGVPHNRLALAKWLVSPENPLTARVTVNRYWQQFFGTGIVKTVEDFGLQGEKPSHPDLLDWLAVEFRDAGWNVKALHRLIVTSATYRQSSKVTPELFERDPENRLLARGARFRMPSFMLRDQALAASGLLVEKLGGPSVKAYQPPGVWEEATFGQIKYQQDHGDALYRRSLYVFWRRISMPTEFFDTASRQTCTVKQSRTNTPLQALLTLNDTTYVEAARAMAQRVMREGGEAPEARLSLAYQLLLGRKPTARETSVLLASLRRLEKQYDADRAAAVKLLGVGESKRDEALDPVEHAAYTGVCLAILNLDEALTKE